VHLREKGKIVLPELINEGVFTLCSAGGMFFAFYDDTGYNDEILASKSTAWTGTALNGQSPIFDVKGPDAARFLTSICTNNCDKMKVGSIRHAVLCNETGQIHTDGVVMKIAVFTTPPQLRFSHRPSRKTSENRPPPRPTPSCPTALG